MFNTLRCFGPRVSLAGCSLQDALRTFFQPIKTDDPCLDCYTTYKRDATEYDIDYVKKYDEDLNTLIFVRFILSAPAIYLARTFTVSFVACWTHVFAWLHLGDHRPLSLSTDPGSPTPSNLFLELARRGVE